MDRFAVAGRLPKMYEDLEEAAELGLTKKEIEAMLSDGETKGDVEFTEELLEAHNYVVLYFDNEMDWLNAQTLLELKTVKALDSKKGFEKKGVGRVINGAKAIEIIRGNVEKKV